MKYVKVKIDGRPAVEVPSSAYVRAKTKQLIEFGYPTLTETDVSEQLEALLAGKKLTVVGKFMEDEVVLPRKSPSKPFASTLLVKARVAIGQGWSLDDFLACIRRNQRHAAREAYGQVLREMEAEVGLCNAAPKARKAKQ